MSTDFVVACLTCRQHRHLGQRYAARDVVSFGYSRDDEEGRDRIGMFILDHMGHDLRIYLAEAVPSGMENVDP